VRLYDFGAVGPGLQGHDARPTARERRGECVASNAVYVDACVLAHNENRTPTHGHAERARLQGAIRQEWRRE